MTKKESILASLNEQQRLPVINFEGPSAVLAAAGSGKTHLVISRVAYMIESGVPASDILVFTFTKKAANEIKERIAARIGKDAERVTIGTYHSFCCRLLRQYCSYLGWGSNFSIFDDTDQEKVLKDVIKSLQLPLKAPIVKALISKWKSKMKAPEQIKTKNSTEETVVECYKLYQMELKRQNAFDFDDLIYYTVRLMQRFPEVQKTINDKYKYIIADESQDSSEQDLLFITLMMGDRKNICLVGDDWQSIYSFRGANLPAFHTFVYRHKLKTYNLEQNYRSTQVIVNAANSVIKQNKDQFEKTAFSKNNMGSKIVHINCTTRKNEAARITAMIKALVRQGYQYKDMAILYRASFLSATVEESFLKNNIPYNVISGTSFYNRKEIKDAMSWVRLLVNPGDMVSLARALQSPKRGIGEKTISQIITCIHDHKGDIMGLESQKDLLDTLKKVQLKGKAKAGLQDFILEMEDLLDLEKPSDVVNFVTDIVGKEYEEIDMFSIDEEKREDARNRSANLAQLLDISRQYKTLAEFSEAISLSHEVEGDEEEDGAEKEEPNQVNLLTVHGSKGLEWPIVFVISSNKNIFPHKRSVQEGNLEEERRLWYVAMTRAKELLVLSSYSSADRINGFEGESSQFISEISKEYIRAD